MMAKNLRTKILALWLYRMAQNFNGGNFDKWPSGNF